MTMAATIPTYVGTGADSGGHGAGVAPPGAGISEQGSDATRDGAGSASAPSWSNFLQALGVTGNIAVEPTPTRVQVGPSQSSNLPAGVSEKPGSSVSFETIFSLPGKVPRLSTRPIARVIAGVEKKQNRVTGIKTEMHPQVKLMGGEEENAPNQTMGVLRDATAIAAILAPVSPRQSSVEKSSSPASHLIAGTSSDQSVPGKVLGNGTGINEVILHARDSHFESESQSMDRLTSDVNLQTTSANEPRATGSTDGNGFGTVPVEIPVPEKEKETTQVSRPTGLVDTPVASIETDLSLRIPAHKPDAPEAASSSSSLKNFRPSHGTSLRNPRSDRVDLANDALNQGRTTEAVYQQWTDVPSPHALNALTEAGYRSGNNLSAVHFSRASASDTFAALDAEHTAAPATWIHAGAHHAEAGYLDPALGWVGVRADAVGNGVHAALLPGSGEAAQVLGSHLAGLSTYLSEHHGQSATVTVGEPQDAMSWSGSGTGGQTGQDHLARENTSQGRQEWQDKQTVSIGSETRPRENSHAATPAAIPAHAGEYISVMA